MAEPLSPSDLSAIQAEHGPVRMNVCGVLVLDGHIDRDAVVRRVRERIELIPRYRMRLQGTAPLGLAYPVWEEDRDFDPDRHVRRVGLPAPGGDAELCELVAHLAAEPLERSRPLWRLVVAEGLAGDRTAVVATMHHALVDGVGAVDVGTVILDATPDQPEPPAGRRSRRRSPRGPTVDQLASRAIAQLHLPRQLARRAVSQALALDPGETARQTLAAAGVVRELARLRPTAPATRLNVRIGPERRYAIARARLDDLKRIRRAASVTVNDVILALISLMLSEYLGPRPPQSVVALVPVSTRARDQRGEMGNRISTVFVDLPLRGRPLARLARISRAMAAIKRSPQVRAGALVVGATGVAPPFVSSLAVRAISQPRLFNLLVTNVPGPQQTFYLAGAPLREVFPAAPLNPRNQALTIGVLSYDGGVYFGLLADRDALPDLAEAAAGVERAVAVLAEEAAGAGGANAPRPAW